MSRGLIKEALRSIAKNKARFISIIAIVAVGISFYAGISAAGPDMKQTAVDYFNDNNLMDIWMVSTVGFNENDVEQIKKVKGVESAVGSKFADGTVVVDGRTAANVDGGQAICRAYGLDFDMARQDDKNNSDYINKLTLIDGRFPEKENECLIDQSDMATPKGFEIGKKIKMVGIEENIENKLNVTEYEIVGVIRTPRYISFERGLTDVGSGTLGCFIYVPETAFKLDYYTEICVTVDGADEFYPFSDEYYDHIEPVIKNIQKISSAQLEVRVGEVTREYNEQLKEYEAEYEQKKAEVDAELGDAFTELEYYRNLVATGDAEIAAAEAQLEALLSNKDQQITQGQNQYAAAKKQYDDKCKELEEAKKQIEENEKLLETLPGEIVIIDERIDVLKAEMKELDLIIPKVDKVDENGNIVYDKQGNPKKVHTSDPLFAELVTSYNEKKVESQDLAYKKIEYEITLSQIKKNLPAAKTSIVEAEKQLAEAKKELDKYGNQIAGAPEEIERRAAEARKQIDAKKKELEEGKAKLAEYDVEYNAAYEEAYAKLDEAKYNIEEAKAKIEMATTNPQWLVQNRTALPGYENYGQTAGNIEAFAKVFPVFFFFVAAMVVLTTMTRMVDEDRTQIGTLKALGFTDRSIRAKYLIYSLVATFIGSIIGLIAGFFAYPNAIMQAYKVVFQLPKLTILFPAKLIILGTFFSVASTTIATYLSCRKEMAAKPSDLMRAKAPKSGRRVFLEKIPFIWKRMNFSAKVTTRNLFRNKKRVFVTFFGIIGCMALLLTGFGLNDSINQILTAQYGEGGVSSFDAQIALKNSQISANESPIYNSVLKNENIKDAMMFYNKTVEGSSEKSEDTLSVYLFVPQSAKKINDFVDFRSRTSDKTYNLTSDGVIITEKFAKRMNVSVGDAVSLKFNDELTLKLAVTGIVENYAFHYVYMSPTLYSQIFQAPVPFNYMYAKYADGIRGTTKADDVATELMKYNDINAVVDAEQTIKTFDELFDCLNLVIAIFIISAALLAFIVLYTLTSININERRREIASLKVLGFYDRESTSYVSRENYIITSIAIAVGLVLGYYLHKIVVAQAEVNVVMFGRVIEPLSYLYAVGLTLIFAIIVNVVMHFVIKRIDMVESLKSVD